MSFNLHFSVSVKNACVYFNGGVIKTEFKVSGTFFVSDFVRLVRRLNPCFYLVVRVCKLCRLCQCFFPSFLLGNQAVFTIG